MNDCIRKLANGHWNTRYVGPDGRRYSRTFRVKRDATYWRSHELRLIDLDQWSPPPSRNANPAPTSVLTVAEWTEQCIQAREKRSRRPIRPTTPDIYRKLTGSPAHRLRERDLDLTKGNSTSTRPWPKWTTEWGIAEWSCKTPRPEPHRGQSTCCRTP